MSRILLTATVSIVGIALFTTLGLMVRGWFMGVVR
jgi:hypothetical protein